MGYPHSVRAGQGAWEGQRVAARHAGGVTSESVRAPGCGRAGGRRVLARPPAGYLLMPQHVFQIQKV